MKKQITLATFLVASVALANAAPTTIHGFTYDETVVTPNANLNTTLSGKSSIAVKIEDSPGGADNFAFSGPEFKNTNNTFLWVTKTGIFSVNNHIDISSFKLDDGVTFGGNITTNNPGTFSYSNNGVIWLNNSGFLDINVHSNGKIGLRSGFEGKLFLNEKGRLHTNLQVAWSKKKVEIHANLLAADEATGTGSYSVSENADAAGVYLITRTLVSSNSGTGDFGDNYSMNFGSELTESSSELTIADATLDNLGKYFINETNSLLQVTYIATASSIPEPSTFGLLAGLGALALVASRRRRSRKVA